MKKKPTYQVNVNCADGHGLRSYGRYVGFEKEEVVALTNCLPNTWTVEIVRA